MFWDIRMVRVFLDQKIIVEKKQRQTNGFHQTKAMEIIKRVRDPQYNGRKYLQIIYMKELINKIPEESNNSITVIIVLLN